MPTLIPPPPPLLCAFSGPFRYDYFEGKWVYPRDGHHMLERLQKELARLTGADPDLSPCYGCGKLNSCQGELCR